MPKRYSGPASRSSFILPSAFCLLLSSFCLSSPGCAGYQLGNQSLYPSDIKTVFVPVFECDSFRRNLGERLTEAVVKEIERKTPYKVVGSPDADSILAGRIITERKGVLSETINEAKAGHQLTVTTFSLLYAADFADRLEHEILPAGVPGANAG